MALHPVDEGRDFGAFECVEQLADVDTEGFGDIRERVL